MHSAVLAIVNPSVRHTLALCQYGSCYTITRSSLDDSPMTLVSSRSLHREIQQGR